MFYCVLRNHEKLPEWVENDVDIWCDNAHRNDLYAIVERLALTLNCILSYAPRLTLRGEGNYFLIKLNKEMVQVIHVDVWVYVHWKGICYVDESHVRRHLIYTDRGFYTLPYGIEASINLLKDLLHHGKVKEKYKSIIQEYSKEDPDNFFESIRKPFGERVAKYILEMTNNCRWEILEKNSGKLRLILLLRSFLHLPTQIKRWFYYTLGYIRRFFTNPRGLLIVFIGPDGAGKSTTANLLIQSEISKLFQKKSYFHGHFNKLPELKKILGIFRCGKKEESNKHQNYDGVSQKPFGILRAMIYPIYYGIEYLLGHLYVWLEKIRGNLIIFDRYYYDYLLQDFYSRCPRWLIYFISKIIPKPDLIIYLKNNAEAIYQRKPELSLPEIRRQLLVCDTMIQRFKNSIIVDTEKSPSEVIVEIQKIMIKRLAQRRE